MNKKVSVILPCYNVEKYLNQCLDSIVNQTLKEIEIICIDDGSTDNTLTVLNDFANKDSRIKVLTQQNKGPGAARNAGLDIATGEFVSMLDSDDFFKLDMLENFYKEAISKNTDILICESQEYYDKKNKYKKLKWALRKKYLPFEKIFNYKNMPKHIIGFCVGWAWDKFYKKSFIDKYNLRYAELMNSEDLTFVFLSLVLASRISIINEVFISHRKREDSVEMTRDKNPYDFIIAAQNLRNNLISYGKYEEVEQSFLNWFVPFSFWYTDTLKDENNLILKQKLENEIFKDFNVYEKEQTYFYDKAVYYRLNGKEYVNLKFIEKIFSIKTSISKKYKVITILGLQIKLKRKKDVSK